ncbi:MAG: UDP-N-acetylglucosamine--N-acetylmuramyl-(pentapeptide) pyrophosphoryl-undecaprenol N-acetylglucosamine transferase [Pleomorphochaeta sp.]
MKIVFCGGGTLGHIYPSLSIIEYIRTYKKDESFEFVYIGRDNEKEKSLIEGKNLKYYSISCGKFRRYFSIKNLNDIIKIFRGYYQAKKILKLEKPDIIFSKGGYVSVPVVYAAKRLNIKIITHESDITLGLATKLNMKVASKVLKGFPLNKKEENDSHFVYCGNPIRLELLSFKNININEYEKKILSEYNDNFSNKIKFIIKKMNETFDSSKPIILVIGGSLGALEINQIIDKNINKLTENYNVYHQMGDYSFREKEMPNYICTKFINEELGYLFRKADLVISRCGANALNEELFFQKNILAIPLKNNSSRGEQVLNSNYYKKLGLLDVLENSSKFMDTVEKLFDNENIRKRKESYENYDIINSNELIYEEIVDLLK